MREGSPYAHRGLAGGESGGVERHARDQLGSVLVRTEDQMRSLVSITADSDSSLRKWGQYPARTASRTGPPWGSIRWRLERVSGELDRWVRIALSGLD